MRKEVKTQGAAIDAIKKGQAISVTGMIALTLANIAGADIIVMPGAYLNLTLDSSQATVETWGSSQATVKTLGSSQATVKTRDSSQATVKTLGSSQATVETWGSSQATVTTWDSSQATVETRDSSQATVKTWGSKCPVPASITSVGGEPLPSGTPELLGEVAVAALASEDALRMDSWHCGTSHCIAGWATHLAGERGKELENRLGTATAGLILLGRDAQAHFYDTNEQARAWLAQFLPKAEPVE